MGSVNSNLFERLFAGGVRWKNVKAAVLLGNGEKVINGERTVMMSLDVKDLLEITPFSHGWIIA